MKTPILVYVVPLCVPPKIAEPKETKLTSYFTFRIISCNLPTCYPHYIMVILGGFVGWFLVLCGMKKDK